MNLLMCSSILLATNPNLLLTACNDTHIRIFDVRSLASIPSKDSSLTKEDAVDIKHASVQFEREVIEEWSEKKEDFLLDLGSHGAACTNANWSPDGLEILSTSYDSKLRGKS